MDFKTKIKLGFHKLYRKLETDRHNINMLFWECTLRCNFNCLHCGSSCDYSQNKQELHYKEFIKIIDEIKDKVEPQKTFIAITGGEPLLRNDLEICGMELIKRNFYWGIVTNGFLLTKQRFDNLLKSGLSTISISLDGLEKNHNWLRNNSNSFKKAVNAIELVTQTKSINYDIISCINKRNINELNELKNFLIQSNVKNWRILSIFSQGRAKENSELQLDKNELVKLLDFIKLSRMEKKINIYYGCESFLGDYELKIRDRPFFCRAGINIASILANGDISACPSLRDNFIQGNIKTDNFLDCWNNKFQIYRDRTWTKTNECAACKDFKYCNGGSLHLRNETTKQLDYCHCKMIEN